MHSFYYHDCAVETTINGSGQSEMISIVSSFLVPKVLKAQLSTLKQRQMQLSAFTTLTVHVHTTHPCKLWWAALCSNPFTGKQGVRIVTCYSYLLLQVWAESFPHNTRKWTLSTFLPDNIIPWSSGLFQGFNDVFLRLSFSSRCPSLSCVSLCADAEKKAHGQLSRSVSLRADACAEGNCPHSDRSM